VEQWKRLNSGASQTSEADSETRLSDGTRSRANSTNEDHRSYQSSQLPNRPIIQDESGYVRQLPSEETKSSFGQTSDRWNNGAEKERSSRSSSSSSSSNEDQNQNKNKQNQKSDMNSSRERDEKIVRYLYYLIISFDVPDLSRLYQWWTQHSNSKNMPKFIKSLQQSTMTETQLRLGELMFCAFEKWDRAQDEEGAVGLAPNYMSDANCQHFELLQAIKYLSSRLLSEVSYVNTSD